MLNVIRDLKLCWLMYILAASAASGQATNTSAGSGFTVNGSPISGGCTEQAKMADAFVDSIGVNTHWVYPNVYSKEFAGLKRKLGESGIRHIRDSAAEVVYPKALDLYRSYGIRVTLVCGRRKPGAWPQPLDASRIPEELAGIKAGVLSAVEALEDPNEYDLSRPSSEQDTWSEKLCDYCKTLYAKIKADPELGNLPVIAPSLTSEEAFKKIGDLAPWIDFSCAHPYLGGRNPGTPGWGDNGYGSIGWTLAHLTDVQGPDKPVQFTECGYHNALQARSGHVPCSEAAEGKYLPRMFAEYFRRGTIKRAFKYELVDEGDDPNDIESHFGLLRSDLSEKPAFGALKNLIAVLKDAGAAFQPDTLDFALEGATNHVRHVLLQKRDRTFYLLLWNEVPSWDVTKRNDIANADVPVTLRVAAPLTGAQVCCPNDGSDWKDLPRQANALVLSVPDKLLILRLTVGEVERSSATKQ